MSDLVGKAVHLAIKAHAGQKRRYSGEPYIIHPMRVADILINELGIEDERSLALAFVHDISEDGGEIYSEPELVPIVGPELTVGILRLSKNWGVYNKTSKFDEDKYWQHITHAPNWTKIVKLADRIDNLRDYERVVTMNELFGDRTADKIKEKMVAYMQNTKKYVLPIAKDTDMKAHQLLKEIVGRYIPE